MMRRFLTADSMALSVLSHVTAGQLNNRKGWRGRSKVWLLERGSVCTDIYTHYEVFTSHYKVPRDDICCDLLLHKHIIIIFSALLTFNEEKTSGGGRKTDDCLIKNNFINKSFTLTTSLFQLFQFYL